MSEQERRTQDQRRSEDDTESRYNDPARPSQAEGERSRGQHDTEHPRQEDAERPRARERGRAERDTSEERGGGSHYNDPARPSQAEGERSHGPQDNRRSGRNS